MFGLMTDQCTAWKDSMETKVKSVPSVPPNYVSILQLQERWLKEKERKQKQVKQEVGDGQGRREEDNVMKVAEAMEPRVKKLGEKGIGGEEELQCVEREKFGENGGGGYWKKKKNNLAKKKKKNQSGSVEEVVKCESKMSPAYIPKENSPVKEEIQRAHSSKGDTAVETQLGDLLMSKRVKEEEETREVKGAARLSNAQSYYRTQKHVWSSTRVSRGTGAMVWVKKENNGAGGGNGV